MVFVSKELLIYQITLTKKKKKLLHDITNLLC